MLTHVHSTNRTYPPLRSCGDATSRGGLHADAVFLRRDAHARAAADEVVLETPAANPRGEAVVGDRDG